VDTPSAYKVRPTYEPCPACPVLRRLNRLGISISIDLRIDGIPLLLSKDSSQLSETEEPEADVVDEPLAEEHRAQPDEPREASVPEPVRSAEPGAEEPPDLLPGDAADERLGELVGRHLGVRLAEPQPLDEEVVHGAVVRVRRQRLLGPVVRDVGLHRADHGAHDAHAERLELLSQGAAVAHDGPLAGAVRAAEDVRHHGRQRGDVDDEALGGDELLREGSYHGHHTEYVDLEGLADIVDREVGCRESVCTATVDVRSVCVTPFCVYAHVLCVHVCDMMIVEPRNTTRIY